MRAISIASLLIGINAAGAVRGGEEQHQFERALSSSGDMSFDDDFWAYDEGSMSVMWDDYAMIPKTCMIYKNNHVIAFDMYGKGNKSCARKKDSTYIMDVGKFAKAYVAQKQIDYKLVGNDYGDVDALDYLECTAVEYNDVYYYSKLGCSGQGTLKLNTYTDEYCSHLINTNVGIYNDLKIQFDTCQSCVSWPTASYNDDGDDGVDVDDNFENYHMYDSKLCGAADEYKQSCKWGCKRKANSSSKGSYSSYKSSNGWGGFEKFSLFFWSFAAVALVWIVLKQRRMMSREDAIIEEAAMNGAGLKKRHVFPLALGIIFTILLCMFMVWKKLTWLLLIGTNAGLFTHFVFLRRKAKRASSDGGEYMKDAGLEIH